MLSSPLYWAGSKRALVPTILSLFDTAYEQYVEPFAGSASVLFALAPQKAWLNDLNPHLIHFYRVLQTESVDALIPFLEALENTPECFQNVRQEFNEALMEQTLVQAVRFFFLNRTCRMGLWRVNRQGRFNVPFGYRKQAKWYDTNLLRAISTYLQTAQVRITCLPYEQVLAECGANDLVYLDPPYDIGTSSKYTSYTAERFERTQQAQLASLLVNAPFHWLLSNAPTEWIQTTYRGIADQRIFYRHRGMNSIGTYQRGTPDTHEPNEILLRK